jgi:hypothetical protein
VLLAVLTIGNAIWEGRWLQAGQFALATLTIFAFGALMIGLGGRSAVSRGAPPPRPDPEAVPWTSLGSVCAALSLALIMFGFVFGSSLIYLGAGFLAFALGRVALEVRAQRDSVRRARSRREEP